MGFKPRPPPPPPPPASPGNIKRGFVEKRVSSSPGFLRRKSSVSKEPETIRKSNSWWNLNDAEEDGRRSSVRSSKCKSSSVPQSPSTGSRKSISTRASSTTRTPAPPSTTPKNSTKKIQFRHKVFCNGQILYEWEQNPKFVTIYYPTPNADYKAFCNIASGHVQLGTKPKGLPTKWFLSHDTGSKVDVEKSDWKQCKQHCRIILAKDNKGATWSRAIRDDRVDQTTTIKKTRPKMDRAESEPAMMSPSSTKKKWKNPRRISAANVSDDDENSDMESEELECEPNKRTNRRQSSKAAMSRTSAQSNQSPKQRQRRGSKNQVSPQRTRSNCSSTSEKPMSTIFVEEESPMPAKRRSTSQSGAVPPGRSNSARSTNSDKPMSAIFVEKESSSPKMSPKRRISASQSKQPRRPSKNGTAPPKRRMSSRSFDSIDEELPLNNIEVDMNSDLVSVL